MYLQELKNNEAASKTERLSGKTVAIFIDSKFILLSGNWHWNLYADAVFCSDVILSTPIEFTGAKGIIHPDDLQMLKEIVCGSKERIKGLQFRIITTYGEIKELEGQSISVEEEGKGIEKLQNDLLQEAIIAKEYENLRLVKEVYEKAEKDLQTGVWFYNSITNRTWYSNYVYHIYDLFPQSLNAHLHTFYSFIHPDDKDTVIEFIDKAYKHRAPLHIEFRVVTPVKEKFIQYISQWLFNEKGEPVLSGSIRDVTTRKLMEQKLEAAQNESAFHKQLIHIDEQNANIGHWQVNMVTRKAIYSDNLYRIYGLRPGAIPAGVNALVNYVHPDDREIFAIAVKQMMNEHKIPDLDYRIIRTDGKMRYISQRGRLLNYGNEMVMAGFIQDITAQKMPEIKVAQLTADASIKAFVYRQTEEMTSSASWIWNVDKNKITWSDSFYRLLGLKPGAVELTHKHLLLFIHPHDQKKYNDELIMASQQAKETEFEFRMVLRGDVKYMKTSFRMLPDEDENLLAGIMQDITAEKLLKEQLYRQTLLSESLTLDVHDRVIITDVNNTILLWNNQCEQVYKTKSDDAIGKNFFDVLPQLKTEEQLHLFNQVLKGEAIYLQNCSSLHGQYHLHMLPLWSQEKTEVVGITHIMHDVTKETELQQGMNERLHFIESLVEASVDKIIVMDSNMNYLIWNKRCEEYYGLKKEQVIGKNVLEIFPGSINELGYADFKKALRGETVYLPASEDSADGHYHEIYLVPIKNEKGEVIAVLWMLHDLTKEYLVSKEYQKAHTILDTINEACYELDNNGTVIFVNSKAEELFSLTKEEMLGKNVWELFPESVNTHCFDAIQIEALQNKNYAQFEYVSGVLHTWISLSATPTADGCIVLFREIEDIMQARQKLQEEHDRLKEVQAIGHIADYEGDLATMNFIFSDELFRIFGREPGSFKPTLDFIDSVSHPDDAPVVRQILEEAVANKTSYHYNRRIFRPDGEMRFVTSFGKVVCDAEGNAIKLVGTVQDVTEQKIAEEEMKKNLAILQQSEDLARIGSWEYDITSGAFNWSAGMYRMFGIEQGTQVSPEIYLDFAMEEDRSAAKQVVRNIKEEFRSFDETLKIKQGGSEKILRIKATQINDEEGHPKKVVGVDLDITDAKIAEEKIKEGQNLLQQTTLATPDAITIYDLDKQQPVYLNSCLGQWVGYTNEELVDMGMEGRLQLIHPDDRKKITSFNDNVRSAPDGEIITLDYRLKAKNGKTLWVRNRAKVFKRNAGGTPTHVLSVLQDFTKEVQLHNQLTERTQYAEAIIDANVDRMFVYDKSFTILAWNKRSEEVLGVKKEQAVGKNLKELFPKLWTDEALVNAFHKALEGEFVYLPAKRAIYANGHFERFYVPLKNNEGETYAVLSIIHDVSEMVFHSEELKELNKTLERKNKELEEKNEEISSFAFIASHDLKEPLRKLYTFSDWLLQRETAGLSDTGKSYVKKIANSVKRMDMLIEDILILAKIDADKKAQKIINLNAILDAVVGEMKEYIKQSGTEIIIEKLPAITGSDNQIFYLFKNLLSNAIKFQERGNQPVVKIKAEQIESSEVNNGKAIEATDYFRVSFTDNGLGFETKYAKKIFQVFQRLHGNKEFEGTGMGLAICRKIMENHGGFIAVESEPGKGSVFSCYFPVL